MDQAPYIIFFSEQTMYLLFYLHCRLSHVGDPGAMWIFHDLHRRRGHPRYGRQIAQRHEKTCNWCKQLNWEGFYSGQEIWKIEQTIRFDSLFASSKYSAKKPVKITFHQNKVRFEFDALFASKAKLMKKNSKYVDYSLWGFKVIVQPPKYTFEVALFFQF